MAGVRLRPLDAEASSPAAAGGRKTMERGRVDTMNEAWIAPWAGE